MAVDKLSFLNQQMLLEPAEEAESAARPAGWVDPNRRAPCGHSPAELRAAFDWGPPPCPRPSRAAGRTLLLAWSARTGHPPGGHAGRRPHGAAQDHAHLGLRAQLLYCPFRAGRNYRRATFKPDEMAQVFTQIAASGAANGLFLSSGVAACARKTACSTRSTSCAPSTSSRAMCTSSSCPASSAIRCAAPCSCLTGSRSTWRAPTTRACSAWPRRRCFWKSCCSR